MKGLEKVYIGKKLVGVVIRKSIEVNNGISFFTAPKDPLQFAIHNHSKSYESKIQSNKLIKSIVLNHKHKFIYLVTGTAKVEFILESGKVRNTIAIQKGDSIIIRNILHKVIFSPKSKVIEIKQGPYKG